MIFYDDIIINQRRDSRHVPEAINQAHSVRCQVLAKYAELEREFAVYSSENMDRTWRFDFGEVMCVGGVKNRALHWSAQTVTCPGCATFHTMTCQVHRGVNQMFLGVNTTKPWPSVG